MRLFVAVEPSAEVRAAAVRHSAELRARLAAGGISTSLRWIPEENLHLTVWFLGEVSDARSAPVLEALRPALATPRFRLHIAGFGAFPPAGAPRVVWMGVTHGIETLARAHDEVGERLRPWGFTPEARAYSAHLTVARVKEPRGALRATLRAALSAAPADAGACDIDALTVFRSRTAPAGAVYEPLLRVPLS